MKNQRGVVRVVKKMEAHCDAPGCDKSGAVEYEVVFPDGTLSADLCPTHAAVLVDLRSQLPRVLFLKRGQRKKAVRVQVDPNAI